MRTLLIKIYKYSILFLLLSISVSAFGCAGLSRQWKSTMDGMQIEYKVQKEQIKIDKPVNIVIFDERENKDAIGGGAKYTMENPLRGYDVIGKGAKSIMGNIEIGYFAFEVLLAFAPNEPYQPFFQSKSKMDEMFLRAFSERLSRNGVELINTPKQKEYSVEVYLKNFLLDFHYGIWTGEVGYEAIIKEGDKVICDQVIFEKAKKFNFYGFGSGEEAVSAAFNLAINRLDLNGCFSPQLRITGN